MSRTRCFPSLSFFCICTAEWMWHTHSNTRTSRRRLIINNLDDCGFRAATFNMLARIILARISLTAFAALKRLLPQVFAIHVAL